MVADATRGVKFVLKTELDSDVSKPFDAMLKQVDALQARMNSLKIPAPAAHQMAGGSIYAAHGAAARAAERAAREREQAAERGFRLEAKWNRMAEEAVKKREAAEAKAMQRAEREANRTADAQAREAKRAADAQVRELKRVERERQHVLAEAAREDVRGWKNLSAMGKESFVGGRKVAAGFEALSDLGRGAMPRDRFADGLKKMREANELRTGWAGLGRAAEDTQAKLSALRALQAADDEKQKRALEGQKDRLREINSTAYDVVHSFGQLTRAAAQFGVVGQRDMMKVLDTIFAVEGGVNALEGGMNAFRAIKSIHEARAGTGAAAGAAKWASGLAQLGGAGAGTAAIGAKGTAAAAGAATAGAPVAAIGAAAAGIVAALASAGLTIREAFRHGIGGGAHVGGIVDRVASAEVGIASKITGFGHSIAGSAIDAFAPYGLTSRERELRTEGYLQSIFGQGILAKADVFGISRTALSNRKTERIERFQEEDRQRRAELDVGHTRFFEQQFGVAAQLQQLHERRRERERMLADNFNPLTREGPLLAAQHRQRADMQATIEEKQGLQERAAAEYREKIQRGMIGRGSDLAKSAEAEIVGYEKEIRDLMTQQAQLTREMQKTGIEGLKQQLELRKQLTETARGKFETAFGSKQSLEERLGAMNPVQVRAIARAKEKAEKGVTLDLHDINLLQQGDERSQFLAKQAYRKRYRGFSAEDRGTLGDVEDRKAQASMNSASAAYERQGELSREILGREREAGIARSAPVQVDARFQTELKLQLDATKGYLNDLNTKFQEEVVPQIENAFAEHVESFAEQVTRRVLAKMDQKIANQNQQGRNAAAF